MYCLGIIALELLIGTNEIIKLNIHRFFYFFYGFIIIKGIVKSTLIISFNKFKIF